MIYKHVKRGTLYKVITEGVALWCNEDVSEGQKLDICPVLMRQIIGLIAIPTEIRAPEVNVVMTAILQSSGGALSDDTDLVIYRGLEDGKLWARSVEEFHDGRFVKIED